MTREEQLACLKDRPCDVCKMRTDKGCSSWECVFEQAPEDESICNREQEPVLDKIKAEIEKQIERDFAFAKTETQKVPYHYGIATGLQNATRIIDSVINVESEGMNETK